MPFRDRRPIRRALLPASLAVALLVAFAAFATTPAAATNIVVNSDADVVDPNDGQCTLREAILSANFDGPSGGAVGECSAGSAGTRDLISFRILGPGVHTIVLTDDLPIIVEPVLIDGYTQTGAVRNTLPDPANGTNAVLTVQMFGDFAWRCIRFGTDPVSSSTGSSVHGLNLIGCDTAGIEVLIGADTHIGDYVTVTGEKVHEQLYIADSISVLRPR